MSKQYHFDIDYIDTRYNQKGRGAVAATSILDAKIDLSLHIPLVKLLPV
ncbi:hypothetical protein V6W75_06930 [Mannheimia sp. HC-2023]